MIVYGFTPTWSSKSSRYGWWKNIGELWGDDGWAWELQPPKTVMEQVGDALRAYYLPAIKAMLS
ncbi:MAG: hypothetical protein KGL39_38050 [Patescibacteria group bacterium]|nr:hypothetical protein [Patescibacteria group bacterium]